MDDVRPENVKPKNGGSMPVELKPAPAWTRAVPLTWWVALGRLPPLGFWFLRCLAARDSRDLCRRLRLTGWRPSNPDRPAPRQIDASAHGLWQIAAWALACYRGPVVVDGHRLSLDAPASAARPEHLLRLDSSDHGELSITAKALPAGKFSVELRSL